MKRNTKLLVAGAAVLTAAYLLSKNKPQPVSGLGKWGGFKSIGKGFQRARKAVTRTALKVVKPVLKAAVSVPLATAGAVVSLVSGKGGRGGGGGGGGGGSVQEAEPASPAPAPEPPPPPIQTDVAPYAPQQYEAPSYKKQKSSRQARDGSPASNNTMLYVAGAAGLALILFLALRKKNVSSPIASK